MPWAEILSKKKKNQSKKKTLDDTQVVTLRIFGHIEAVRIEMKCGFFGFVLFLKLQKKGHKPAPFSLIKNPL